MELLTSHTSDSRSSCCCPLLLEEILLLRQQLFDLACIWQHKHTILNQRIHPVHMEAQRQVGLLDTGLQLDVHF